MAESSAARSWRIEKTPAEGCIRLPHRLDAAGVRKRLGRFGADRFEPAGLMLWTMAIGKETESPSAWLLGAGALPRALLLPGGTLMGDSGSGASPSATFVPGNREILRLEGGVCPSTAQFERWWLWERLTRPRRWAYRVQPSTLCRVELPLWLGYRDGRRTRLIVLSGLSGEPLGALKSTVLGALKDHHHGVGLAAVAER